VESHSSETEGIDKVVFVGVSEDVGFVVLDLETGGFAELLDVFSGDDGFMAVTDS
jgi:hypothetical protein